MRQIGLVITVTGGAAQFSLSPQLRKVFRRGLVKAAQDSNAIIITGGTNSGVMRHVGKAVQEYRKLGQQNSDKKTGVEYTIYPSWFYSAVDKTKIPLIGFSSYQIIRYNDDMREHFKSEKQHDMAYYYNHNIDDDDGKEGHCLDPNHNYHILLDDEIENSHYGQIKAWAQTEHKIRFDGDHMIPGVLVCLQGGPGTLETCAKY